MERSWFFCDTYLCKFETFLQKQYESSGILIQYVILAKAPQWMAEAVQPGFEFLLESSFEDCFPLALDMVWINKAT